MEIILLCQKEKRCQLLKFLLTWHKIGSKYGTKLVQNTAQSTSNRTRSLAASSKVLSLRVYKMRVHYLFLAATLMSVDLKHYTLSPAVDTATPSVTLNEESVGNKTAELPS
jgi:hypothetical protein